jgi:hypothetical protein
MESPNGNPHQVFAKNPNLRIFFTAEDGEKFSTLSDAEVHSDRQSLDLEEILKFERFPTDEELELIEGEEPTGPPIIPPVDPIEPEAP